MTAFENDITKLSYCQLAVKALNGRSTIGCLDVDVLSDARGHLRRLQLRVHEPQGGVGQVDAPVGDGSAAVIPVVPPLPLATRLVGLRGAGPWNISQFRARRNRHDRLGRPGCPPPPYCSTTCVTPPSCGSSAAASAKCGQLRCSVPTWTIRLVRRAASDHFAAVERRGVAGRLLEVDVLARVARVDVMLRVPVIRRRDQNGIDVLAIEDAAVVFVPSTLLPSLTELLDGGVESLLEHVARGDEDVVRRLRKRRQHLIAATSPIR